MEDKDSINGVQQLSVEATAINQNFSQQVLLQGGRRLQYDEPNPFVAEGSSEELAAVAYRCVWQPMQAVLGVGPAAWRIAVWQGCPARCKVHLCVGKMHSMTMSASGDPPWVRSGELLELSA